MYNDGALDILPSLETLYEESGSEDSFDDVLQSLEVSREMVLIDLMQYMEDHPEITGIEFEGGIRTKEGLNELLSDKLVKLADAEASEETPGEDAASGE